MITPAKLIACAAAFDTLHALTSAPQPTVVRTSLVSTLSFENGPHGGSFAAHETHGTLAVGAFKR